MKRGDSVYFLTLVDFLLNALFFGLVLFAAGRAKSTQLGVQHAQVDTLRKVTGISDLAELTDQLTRLVPLRNARAATTLVDQLGGIEKTRRLAGILSDAGGMDSLQARLQRLALREGAGKPHCLFTTDADGRKVAIPVARVTATDSLIEFTNNTHELRQILEALGVSYESVRELPYAEFRRAFGRLGEKSCTYTLRVRELTNYKYPRETLRGLFYTQFERE